MKLDKIEQKASYAIGVQLGQQLAQSGFTQFDVTAIQAGLSTILDGAEELLPVEELQKGFAYFQEEVQKANNKELEKQADFFKENGQKDNIITTPSGLQYEIITQGTGQRPVIESNVRVHYEGTLLDGTVFDSSYKRGQPAEFGLQGVIKGWTEALQLMPAGSKWKLYIPSELAYGERGAGQAIPPNTALSFEVELLDILS